MWGTGQYSQWQNKIQLNVKAVHWKFSTACLTQNITTTLWIFLKSFIGHSPLFYCQIHYILFLTLKLMCNKAVSKVSKRMYGFLSLTFCFTWWTENLWRKYKLDKARGDITGDRSFLSSIQWTVNKTLAIFGFIYRQREFFRRDETVGIDSN